MKVLIQDTKPDRLAAWLSQVSRPDRVCHLANTADQARYLLMHDPYDIVLLERARPDARSDDLIDLARRGNPDCRILDLPQELSARAVVPEIAPRTAVVRWRKMGAPSQKTVTEANGVRWRVFRRIADANIEPPIETAGDSASLSGDLALAPRAPRPSMPSHVAAPERADRRKMQNA